MNIVLDGKDFRNNINAIDPIVGVNSSIEALEYVLFSIKGEELFLKASNISLTAEIKQNIIKLEEGENKDFLVKGLDISKLSKTITNDTVIIEFLEKTIIIKNEKSKTELPIISSEDFPSTDLDFVDKDKENIVKKDDFISLIEKTKFAVSTDEGRGIIVGEKFEINNGKFRGVGIDGYRIAIEEKQIMSKENSEFVIQGDELSKIQSVLNTYSKGDNLSIFVLQNGIGFKTEDLLLKTKVLEGSFIEYEKIIPTANKIKIEFETADMIKGIKTLTNLWPSDQLISIEFKKTEAKLYIDGEGTVKKNEYKIDTKNDGEDITIGFNSTYLKQIFEAIKDGTVVFGVNEKNSPVTIRAKENGSYVYVILPVEL